MDDIVELSSDSNDTIIVPIKDNSENFYELSIFEERGAIYKKEIHKNINQNFVKVSDTDTSNNVCKPDNVLKQLYAKYLPAKTDVEKNNWNNVKYLNNHDEEPKRKTMEVFNADFEGDDLLSQIPSRSEVYKPDSDEPDADKLLKELYAKYLPTKVDSEENKNEMNLFIQHNNQRDEFKRKLSNEEDESEGNLNQKLNKKQMLEHKKNKKKLEQQNKSKIIEKEKALKNSLKTIQKMINPDECLKNIIVKIDETLIEQFGTNITETLKSNNISYKSVKQICNGVVSWIRKIQTMENLIVQNTTSDEKHYLLVLPSTDFKSLVCKNNLNTHIHSIWVQLRFHHLTIAVFGLDKLSDEQEYAVMECEMFFKCYWQFVKKINDLSSLIFTITKAVAQIPYKLEQQEKYKLQNEYFAGSNKDTVRVDNKGNGLARLWNQMLTMLPLARLETAEAISSVYPTPSSLFKAYEECELDKESLIQNLQIRRANGPLAAARKIGPELSKRCANFFTSTENVFI